MASLRRTRPGTLALGVFLASRCWRLASDVVICTVVAIWTADASMRPARAGSIRLSDTGLLHGFAAGHAGARAGVGFAAGGGDGLAADLAVVGALLLQLARHGGEAALAVGFGALNGAIHFVGHQAALIAMPWFWRCFCVHTAAMSRESVRLALTATLFSELLLALEGRGALREDDTQKMFDAALESGLDVKEEILIIRDLIDAKRRLRAARGGD